MTFTCSVCKAEFTQKRNLQQHNQQKHTQVKSNFCSQTMTISNEDDNYVLHHVDSALRGYIHSYQLTAKQQSGDASTFLIDGTNLVKQLCQQHLTNWTGLKLFLSLNVAFIKEPSTNADENIDAHFNSPQHVILQNDEVVTTLDSARSQIMGRIEAFVNKGSGWTVKSVRHLDIHVTRYQPLRGSSYEPLPSTLVAKKAILNIQNSDQRCFMWSVLASLHTATQNANRVNKYTQFTDELNFGGVPFPVELKSISKFENQNSISVNVFGYEEGDVVPLFISKTQFDKVVDLMFYKGHYSLVKDLDRLLADQNLGKRKMHFCRRCLIPQYSRDRLVLHTQHCIKNEPAKVKLPTTTTMCFKNTNKMLRAPYVIYADFECILEGIPLCLPDPSTSFTQRYQRHTPCSFGLIEVLSCCKGSTNVGIPHIYRGENPVYHFLNKVITLSKTHQDRMNNPRRLVMSDENWKQFRTSQQCIICEKSLTVCDKVKDHCHLCGIFRGAAHMQCNVAYSVTRNVTVLFHNLRRYDGILIVNQIAIICNERGLEIDCLPKGVEDYISFSIKLKLQPKRAASTAGRPAATTKSLTWKIRFVDTLQFLSCSLDRLVSNLRSKGVDQFHAFNKLFGAANANLLLRKGIYCYDYMDSVEKFAETTLPGPECFYSTLTGEHITAEEYAHAQDVWREMRIQSLGQYHDLYLQTDVVLLCDVFEQFRSFALDNYCLDPVHYLTLPSFSWDACLKHTGVQLELLQDAEMYTFFERGIRGGISMISHRYAKANNIYLPEFDPGHPSSFIIYLDANNLYGWSLIQKLPVKDFRWLNQHEIAQINWASIDCDGDIGYVLEVDLHYPDSCHDLHNEYPLAPEQLQITPDTLSEYACHLNQSSQRPVHTSSKLTPNLYPKQRYLIHCKNLKLYLRLGLILETVHRVIAFTQTAWMSSYINFNTEKRKYATNEFEKDLFKLLNNSTFGKSMENVRKHVYVRLVTESSKLTKLSASPRYQFARIFDNDLVAVSMQKVSVNLCKPIYVGFSVLDLSKSLMYEFHYDYMKTKYGNSCQLLLTDTDSLCYVVTCDDLYQKLKEDIHKFDTSNYPIHHPLYSQTNKKVVGLMKDEMGGEPISEFIGLRAKMYSMLTQHGEKKRAKGVKKSTTSKCIRHDMYKQTLFRCLTMRHSMNLIHKDKHHIYSITQNKVSLSAYDDKRYLLPDGISSFAYGHYKVRKR